LHESEQMKIRWNWGTKLLISLVFFIGLLVVLAYLSTRHSIMLVEEDYYPKGLKYQDRLDEIDNARPLAEQIRIYQEVDEVVIEFPDIKPDTGTVLFFRPSGEEYDRSFQMKTEVLSVVSFPKSAFTKGKYLVKIYWMQDGRGYFIERPFYFN
jgi:hypothetical protein